MLQSIPWSWSILHIYCLLSFYLDLLLLCVSYYNITTNKLIAYGFNCFLFYINFIYWIWNLFPTFSKWLFYVNSFPLIHFFRFFHFQHHSSITEFNKIWRDTMSNPNNKLESSSKDTPLAEKVYYTLIIANNTRTNIYCFSKGYLSSLKTLLQYF